MPISVEKKTPAIADEEIEIDLDSIDFSDIEAKYAVEERDLFASVLIVDNVPVVDEAKEPKLLAVLKKIFAKFGKIAEDAIHMPMVDDPKNPGKLTSKGFLFLDCGTPEAAADFMKQADGHRLDKVHVFAVTKFSDFDKYLNAPDEYQPPKEEEYKEKEQLNYWLLDQEARDQYCALAGEDTHIFWNTKTNEPDEEHKRPSWTDTYLQWSPYGTYLATFHKQGVALWGGKSWERLVRFVHPGVKLIEFSPEENYVITWSNVPPQGTDHNLRIWDVRSGKLLRGFPTPDAKQLGWPLFRWSPDDKYVARMAKDVLAVYELPNLQLVGGKPIKIDGIKDFCWSPKDNNLAYWTPEIDNTPARVTIINLPSKEIVRTKNLFMVEECKLHWHSEGDYLCVKVNRHTKSKKNINSTLEIFCMREKDVPIEVYEGFKDFIVQSVAWEPQGDRFSVIATENQKTNIFIFKVDKSTVECQKTLDRRNIDRMIWSPKGRFLLLAALRQQQGELEFWDIDDMHMLGTAEHFQASDIEWDPTGRYLVSSVSFWRSQGENGFIMWDFKGQQIFKKTMEQFKQFIWRPRPPTPLSKDQMKKIRKNLKSYSEKFDQQDSQASGAVAKNLADKRKKMWREWQQMRAESAKRWEAERDARACLRGTKQDPVYSDNEEEEEEEDLEEWIEEVIDEKEEIVPEDPDDFD